MESHIRVRPASSPPYPVVIERAWQKEALQELFSRKPASRYFLFTQKNIADLYLDDFLGTLPIEREKIFFHYMDDGETAKHIRHLASHYNAMIRQEADRSSMVLAFGGGVVGDYAGFVAATLLRGIRFVQIPTTLLAAVDSSVGGKVAVNVDLGKNMVGAFYQPEFVYCNTSLFGSLTNREWNCGLAEMCKHALLDETGNLAAYLKRHASELRMAGSEDLQKAILDSAGFKAKVVSQDERESGLRAILNLGHTTAHALESLTHYKRYAHGEAVSRGLVTALYLSHRLQGLAENRLEDGLSLIKALGLPMDTDGLAASEVFSHMSYDKKAVAGVPKFVLLDSQGRPRYGCAVTKEEFAEAWAWQKELFT